MTKHLKFTCHSDFERESIKNRVPPIYRKALSLVLPHIPKDVTTLSMIVFARKHNRGVVTSIDAKESLKTFDRTGNGIAIADDFTLEARELLMKRMFHVAACRNFDWTDATYWRVCQTIDNR